MTGYTDNVPIGPELQQQGIGSNQELSLKRAQTVANFLISQGVKPNLVQTRGLGDADPVAPNDTPQGRAQNRRVELTLAAPAPDPEGSEDDRNKSWAGSLSPRDSRARCSLDAPSLTRTPRPAGPT